MVRFVSYTYKHLPALVQIHQFLVQMYSNVATVPAKALSVPFFSLPTCLAVCLSAECQRLIVWGGFGATTAAEAVAKRSSRKKKIECRDWRVKHAK